MIAQRRLLLLFLLITPAAVPAAPANEATFASVNMLQQVTITQTRNLSFGMIEPPSTGSQDFTVNTDGTIATGPGDGAFIGGHHEGLYNIDGTDGEPLSLTTFNGGCTSPFLYLIGITHDLGLPPVFDVSNLAIGGELRVAFGVAPGTYTCHYGLTAQY